MKIEQQTIIRGKRDYCSVTKLPDGAIQIGSIVLDNTDELLEYCGTLEDLVTRMNASVLHATQPSKTDDVSF